MLDVLSRQTRHSMRALAVRGRVRDFTTNCAEWKLLDELEQRGVELKNDRKDEETIPKGVLTKH